MPEATENPNLRRRPGPGKAVRWVSPLLKPWLWLLRQKRPPQPQPLTVFQSYMVGDFFLALSALKALASRVEVRVLCRPDCLEVLLAEGLEGLPFANHFFLRPGRRNFFRSWKSAWSLRGKLGPISLDFDADPRSAFWLKVAGSRRVLSYSRSHARLFDVAFPLPENTLHQGRKNDAVAQWFLEHRAALEKKGETFATTKTPIQPHRSVPLLDMATAPWIVSCWTRKDTKNWPLDRWEVFLEKAALEKLPLLLLEAPDGDAEFRRFLGRWSGRIGVLRGSLAQIAGAVQLSAGVVTTDNFIGHMAGYYGKPVLWINGSSDPAHVLPRGPKTLCVQAEPMACRPCGHRCVNAVYKDCLLALHPEQVWKAFGELRKPG